MPNAWDVVLNKGSSVYSIDPDSTVFDAVHRMNECKVGALLVLEGDKLVGIFTERDVLRRVLGEERKCRETSVRQVMTSDVICVGPSTDLDEVGAIMQQKRVRHVPVCDSGGAVLGVISIGDINAHHSTHQEAHINYLSEYIYGRA